MDAILANKCNGLICGAGLALGGLFLGFSTDARGEPEPIAAEPLAERNAFDGDVSVRIVQDLDGLQRQTITFDDASRMTVVRFTIQPGAVFPWHTHPGTVLINVAEGDFVFVFAEDCVHRDYAPGSALVDPGDTVHTAYNPSDDEETVVIAVLLGAPAEGALTVPVDAATSHALDEECDIGRDRG